ncbi:helix-turn-helix domain-containing protein [Diaphorobacter sp. HDW4A]|uniref:helix-turn-helix domain-containing protein n=1 Tax=Diaphorobacter sp. HDW4A TaxID=2714924 RepID=UPI00140B0C03|nr:XRE family transcriptional regulator [Diaphorobacter sp. HDW4A]QIL82695.1 helix-turn-helix domain-containing protein [Diaphorobacter sp. HDW4A]
MTRPVKKTTANKVLAEVLPGARAANANVAAAAPPAGKHEVGLKIRKARKERGLTLQQVAASSGLAVSTISKAERGQIALSYEKVLQLGSALDIDMTRLFMAGDVSAADIEGDGEHPTVVKDRFADVQRYETDQYEYSVLCGAYPAKKMQPLVAVINAREARDFSETIRHPGQEFVMVLSGRVRIVFENGETVELGKHEAAYFDSGIGHVYVSLSKQPAEVVSVCC